ncbi:MAG TPA: TonB-dependent receptor plug domain-containing protein, partial [Niabella sp.]|nr:TonB-dependent receptor plug domain-containing protein [Niabella sp.]
MNVRLLVSQKKPGKILLLLSFLLFISFTINAQQVIKGMVLNDEGKALPGVTVAVSGSGTATMTNDLGVYTIAATKGQTLVFTSIGFVTKEVVIGDNPEINITLVATSAKAMDEVVVVGYGTMRKKDLTGAVVQIKPDNLANENPNTVQDILRGTPGLQVGYNASAKGGGSMQIRGQRSVYTSGGHNDPLIILDGMIFYGELSEINPDDIGQIDVLKDASAAAVYGSRAASGVIIITTKKGKQGKPIVNFSANVGATTKSAYREVFGPDAYMKYREDWYRKDTYGKNATTGAYEAYQTSSMLSKPGYYDSPENLGKYGVSIEQWRAYTTNASGESDASI